MAKLIDQLIIKDNQEQVRNTYDKYLKILNLMVLHGVNILNMN